MGPSGRAAATLLAIALVALLSGGTSVRAAGPGVHAQAGGPAPSSQPPAQVPASAPSPAPAPVTAPPRPVPVTYAVGGVVELRENGKRATDRSLDNRNTVVLFEPSRKSPAARPVTVEMTTLKKEFTPRLVVVPVGSTVRFPNSDPILHNVFSISGKNSFDLGLLGKGPGKSALFREPGIVRVFCNVHHGMFAYVYVAATRHWVTPAADGSFRLDGLPAGPGKLTVWNERSAPVTTDLTLPSAAPLRLTLEITMPRVPPHKNKLGKSYGGQNYG